jgi:hypothetical protein
MWPRKYVEFYVHMEFELPERFYAERFWGAYQCIQPKCKLNVLTNYVSKLLTFPDILARVFYPMCPDIWLSFSFKDMEQLEDFCKQIEEEAID